MKRRWIGMAAATVAGVLAVPLTTSAGSEDSGDSLTFIVGTAQDISSLNVTQGYLVIDYEIWNLTLPSLTNKAADDFAIEPGLAESWEVSDDGLTVTYTLRPDMTWSDGEPLDADDVVYTINRSVEEEWYNHYATTANLTAEAPDANTVVITTSVPDPKLPIMDVYIVPQHIYEPLDADQILEYPADDNVAGGPFMITERVEGEFVRLARNPNWYGDRPVIDEVVFQFFEDAESQYNALQAGDIDAIDDTPAPLYTQLTDDGPIRRVGGNQGSFSELAMNAGCETGIGDGHPALQDKLVRQAINFAIDREVLVDKVLGGYGIPGVGLGVSADPSYDLVVPDDQLYVYDPTKAGELLDEAGWVDSNSDGVRDKDGRELVLRFYDRTDGNSTTEFLIGWLNDVGIATEVATLDSDTLTAEIGKGEFDLFTWGWTPFVDPDPMLSYFITDQVSTDPEAPGYNDANWCNAEYDALYLEQNQELDPERRRELVTQMLQIFYDEAPYAVLYKYDDLQAIRADRWENFVSQPAETGPLLFTNTSPAYLYLSPVGGVDGGGDDGGSNTVLYIAIAAAVAIALAGGLFFAGRRKSSADDRE